ncbi:PAS domain-containing sensor histidine kinase [Sabulibacter ruber]|uniref:PAS domain-containing sensor histidine kinase n=1 Tax=Sabulibacter ruber TaxID=2811901 RepID=UPI001A95E5AC|nr:PAS domain-containing sensor histidine kinase [Sabulibacter ruber]
MDPSSELFQALVERTQQAYFAYLIEPGVFTYLSPRFKSCFELPSLEIEPATLLSYVHQDDQAYLHECLQELIERGASNQVECRFQFPGQEEQWVCLNLALVEENSEPRTILGHVEDITTQRQYNDHLKKFSNKKNSVLNIIAHDLAAPLGMISNLAGVLEEELKEHTNAEVHHLINLIEQSSKRGSHIIQEFMNQEFMESTQSQVVTRRVNLVEKMGEMVSEYLNYRGGALLPTKVNFVCSSKEIYAEVDDLKFLQAITNLISNALKFTPEDGQVTVSIEDKDFSILVKVADTGVGIPEKYHATLFEKFTPARRPGLRGEKSIGLGMSIVKTIVEWHKGEIWFESKENQGTTFFIRIPKSVG